MEPRCKYFGVCGGCSNQHVPYSVQLENKRKNLAIFTNFPEDEISVISGDDFNYRNRMDFVFSNNKIGFRKKGVWHSVVDIDVCPISNEKLNLLLREVRDFFLPYKADFFDLKSQVGLFRYAVIRTPSNTSSITIILNDDSPDKSRGRVLVEKFAEVTSAENVLVGYNHKQSDVSVTTNFEVLKGSEFLDEEILGRKLRFHSQAFFQNNTEMARALVSVVRGILERQRNNCNLLDLYGGVGTFGVCLSDLFRKVTVVECVEPAIIAAKKNAELNNITNLDGFVLDAQQINRLNLLKPLKVITDPPRSGMTPKAIERLRALGADSIIYVSCNARQLQRELSKFKEYEVKSVFLVDLFPQTNHFEAVIELCKKYV
ncbi:MAG: 23S rRNA (uracil(1939)-C(5))-methyltransferase RlmD [Candidatus Woesearchaeota archaeon]